MFVQGWYSYGYWDFIILNYVLIWVATVSMIFLLIFLSQNSWSTCVWMTRRIFTYSHQYQILSILKLFNLGIARSWSRLQGWRTSFMWSRWTWLIVVLCKIHSMKVSLLHFLYHFHLDIHSGLVFLYFSPIILLMIFHLCLMKQFLQIFPQCNETPHWCINKLTALSMCLTTPKYNKENYKFVGMVL